MRLNSTAAGAAMSLVSATCPCGPLLGSSTRHITGMSTIMWGNDYPHAEGTFRSSKECIEFNFEGVPDDERAVILGSTLADVVGFDRSVKKAPSHA